MTLIIKEEFINKYCLALSQDKYSSAFKVTLSHTIDGDLYRIDKEYTYTTPQAAHRRFKNIKKGL